VITPFCSVVQHVTIVQIVTVLHKLNIVLVQLRGDDACEQMRTRGRQYGFIIPCYMLFFYVNNHFVNDLFHEGMVRREYENGLIDFSIIRLESFRFMIVFI